MLQTLVTRIPPRYRAGTVGLQAKKYPALLLTAAACLPLLACQQLPAAGAETATETGLGVGACRPPGYDRSALATLKGSGFKIDDAPSRAALALALVPCLADPDPQLRDGVAYEALTTWMRSKALPDESLRKLRIALLQSLSATQPDTLGFRRPFAALVLAEVARADRVEPLFSAGERAELVFAATNYMRSIDDYRGFDEQQGWRHAVAHTADLMMQLSLNEAIDQQQQASMRDAIRLQVSPGKAHFYIYGEPQRLARPIIFMAARGEFSEQDWSDWFAELGSPAPFASWNDIWSSQQGLARLHNTKAFAQVIYVNASASENAAIKALLPGALALLTSLP